VRSGNYTSEGEVLWLHAPELRNSWSRRNSWNSCLRNSARWLPYNTRISHKI
jgi:hypothetical protein